jgi:hypothetical protein
MAAVLHLGLGRAIPECGISWPLSLPMYRQNGERLSRVVHMYRDFKYMTKSLYISIAIYCACA